MTTQPTAETVSREFRRILQSQLSESNLTEIDARNARETDPNICHTHDYIDANVAMLEALETAGFGDQSELCDRLTGGDDELNSIFDHAWKISKVVGFALPIA